MKIKGNTFIVTGGASGLGEAVVDMVIAEGGNAVIFDLNVEGGEGLVKKYGDDKVLFCKVNVVKEDSVKAALDAAVEKFGSVRGCVQCAGVGPPKRVISRKGKVHDLKFFEFVIAVNLIGTFNVLRLVAEHMATLEAVEDERGVFIHTASVAAFEGQIGQAAYSASKAGVVGMTLPIARDLASRGIRVNTIAPGLFETPMSRGLPPKARASLASQVPFPSRFGEPKEYADLSRTMIENQYLNGTVIRIDGSIRMAAM